eukprot:10467381-Ditylum_brightwellii.AAC.1
MARTCLIALLSRRSVTTAFQSSSSSMMGVSSSRRHLSQVAMKNRFALASSSSKLYMSTTSDETATEETTAPSIVKRVKTADATEPSDEMVSIKGWVFNAFWALIILMRLPKKNIPLGDAQYFHL